MHKDTKFCYSGFDISTFGFKAPPYCPVTHRGGLDFVPARFLSQDQNFIRIVEGNHKILHTLFGQSLSISDVSLVWMCTRNLYWSRVRNCSSQYEPLDIIVHEFNPRGHNSKCRHWRSLENMTCYSLHKQTVPWNPFFSLAAVTEFLHSSSLFDQPGPHSCIFFRLFSFWNCIQWIVSKRDVNKL